MIASIDSWFCYVFLNTLMIDYFIVNGRESIGCHSPIDFRSDPVPRRSRGFSCRGTGAGTGAGWRPVWSHCVWFDFPVMCLTKKCAGTQWSMTGLTSFLNHRSEISNWNFFFLNRVRIRSGFGSVFLTRFDRWQCFVFIDRSIVSSIDSRKWNPASRPNSSGPRWKLTVGSSLSVASNPPPAPSLLPPPPPPRPPRPTTATPVSPPPPTIPISRRSELSFPHASAWTDNQ